MVMFLFVLGLFVEESCVNLYLRPSWYPAMEAYGIDTLYLGIVLVPTVLVGSITPACGEFIVFGYRQNYSLKRQVKRYGYSWR